MAKGKIKIATCQFAVGSNVRRNAAQMISMMQRAARRRADLVHFPESALSGYAGVDHDTLDDFDRAALDEAFARVRDAAGKYKIHTVFGGIHWDPGFEKPFNSLYLIGPDGRVKGRYDKRFCTPGDLEHFTPGDHFTHFTLNGVRCTLLICFDLRFPELYRAVRKEKIACVIQSFYNARQEGPSVHRHIMRQTMQTRAADNAFWISMSNASGRHQPYPSCFIRPDGKIVGQLRGSTAGLMINEVDTAATFYDPMKGIRELAIAGRLNNRP